jgi:flavin-binding protein dodecin
MSSHTYRMVEVVGSSPQGVDDAISNGIARANRTLRNLDWFQVTEIRGHLQDGQIADWQVTMKVGFRLDDV